MKRISYLLPVAIIVVIAGLLFFSKTNNSAIDDNVNSAGDRLVIAATIFPISSIAEAVGGDYAHVVTILPPGASPHTYEPTPNKIAELEAAETIFAVGHGADDWIRNLISHRENGELKLVYVDKDITIRKVVAGEIEIGEHEEDMEDEEGHHEHEAGGDDPHYWLSGENSIKIARTIKDELARLDPEHADQYQENLDKFLNKQKTVDEDIKARFAGLENKAIITHHGAWFYFAEAYGLDLAGVFELAPGLEPTANDMVELLEVIEQKNVRAVFLEPQLSEQSVRAFISDTNVGIGTLDPLGGVAGRMSYTELLEYNAQVIENALK